MKSVLSENIKAIHIPISYKKTISNSTLMFLEMQNITLMEGDVWGHRKDINELKDAGHSKDEIKSQLSKETQLSEDLIAFLI